MEMPESAGWWFKPKSLDSLPLMSSPWPTVAILGLYLLVVLKVGPRFMENRKPFALRYLLMAYNLFLVIGSLLFIKRGHEVVYGPLVYLGHCKPSQLPHETDVEINKLAWVYYFSKLVELLDTVFFVLRKKYNQISFLHVYHHTNMAMLTWVYIKIIPVSQMMMIGYMNTVVHILMYSYYFLAAFGPSVQKYLWWKKYLTKLQILQFVIALGMLISLFVDDCEVSREMMILAIGNTITFLVLFVSFYLNAYGKKSQ